MCMINYLLDGVYFHDFISQKKVCFRCFRCVFNQGEVGLSGADVHAGIVPGVRQVHLPDAGHVHLPGAGQVQRPVDQVLSGDCQVQEQYDQVLPGEAEAGKQLEEGKDSLASGWRG